MKTIVALLLTVALTACTIGRAPCPHNKNLPKGRQCDEFLL